MHTYFVRIWLNYIWILTGSRWATVIIWILTGSSWPTVISRDFGLTKKQKNTEHEHELLKRCHNFYFIKNLQFFELLYCKDKLWWLVHKICFARESNWFPSYLALWGVEHLAVFQLTLIVDRHCVTDLSLESCQNMLIDNLCCCLSIRQEDCSANEKNGKILCLELGSYCSTKIWHKGCISMIS